MSETLSTGKQPVVIEGEFISLDLPHRDELSDAFFKGDSIKLFDVDGEDSLPRPLRSASLKFQWVRTADFLNVEGYADISPRLPKEPGITWLDSLRKALAEQLEQSGHSAITFDHDPLSLYVQLDDTYLGHIVPSASLGMCGVDIAAVKIEDVENKPWCEHHFDSDIDTLSPTDLMLDTARLFNLTLNTIVQKYGNASIDTPIETVTLTPQPFKPAVKNEIAVQAVKATALDIITKPKPSIEQQPWPEVSFDQLGGLAAQKDFFMNLVDIVQHPELAKHYDVQPEHVLLHGPDGTGKHSLVRAFCHEIGGDLTTMRSTAVGNSAKLFQTAFEAKKPQVILIENLDMTGVAQTGGSLPIERQILGTYLERARAEYPHVVIAAITDKALQAIDPALIAPDRFITLPVEAPKTAERKDIWRTLTSVQLSLDDVATNSTNGGVTLRPPYAADLDYDRLAEQSDEMTGLVIKKILQDARSLVMRRHIREGQPQFVTTPLLLELIEQHRSTQSRPR